MAFEIIKHLLTYLQLHINTADRIFVKILPELDKEYWNKLAKFKF